VHYALSFPETTLGVDARDFTLRTTAGMTELRSRAWASPGPGTPYTISPGYLQDYPDVAAAGINPLQHFLQFGTTEGRSPVRVSGDGFTPPARPHA
jgi:hypothetical protein